MLPVQGSVFDFGWLSFRTKIKDQLRLIKSYLNLLLHLLRCLLSIKQYFVNQNCKGTTHSLILAIVWWAFDPFSFGLQNSHFSATLPDLLGYWWAFKPFLAYFCYFTVNLQIGKICENCEIGEIGKMLKLVKSVKSVKLVKSVTLVTLVKSVKSVKLIKSVKLVELVKTVKSGQSVKLVQLVIVMKLVKLVKLFKSMKLVNWENW